MSADFEAARSAFLQGLTHQGQGRHAEAEACYRLSLAHVPGRPSTLTNLGAALIALERAAEALPLLDVAVAAEPGNAEAWSHRGLALAAMAQDASALASFDKALAGGGAGGFSGASAAWYHRALCLSRLGRQVAALDSYDQALSIAPALADAWGHRGGLLKDMGRKQEAATSLRRAIELGADARLYGYLLASVGGAAAPPGPPPDYVEKLFDSYAPEFDEHLLGKLNYQAHRVLCESLALSGRQFASVLDLGCGTGLCGPLLRPLLVPLLVPLLLPLSVPLSVPPLQLPESRLEGVDLSAAMLARARQLGVYDRLVQDDIVRFLQATATRPDLVVAADVFIYVGDLQPVFVALRRVIAAGGVFCFSVEAADDAVDFELRPSSRYAQSARYLRELASRHGFVVDALWRAPLREDRQQPVEGFFVSMRAVR